MFQAFFDGTHCCWRGAYDHWRSITEWLLLPIVTLATTLLVMQSWSGWLVYSTMFAACGINGYRFEPWSGLNIHPMLADMFVSMWMEKGLAAMLTSIQSAGVAPKVNLRITQVRKHARDPPWLWNPRQTSPAVQNRSISDPMKRWIIVGLDPYVVMLHWSQKKL